MEVLWMYQISFAYLKLVKADIPVLLWNPNSHYHLQKSPYPEPDEFRPLLHTLFLLDHF
jgi:hypothetical protein